MKSARRFVEQHSADLVSSAVWLFSSGPLGEHRESGIDVDHLEWLIEQTHAVEHREFGGRLDTAALGPIESFGAHAVHAPAGDFRDWDEIRTWTREIVGALAGEMASSSPEATGGRRGLG